LLFFHLYPPVTRKRRWRYSLDKSVFRTHLKVVHFRIFPVFLFYFFYFTSNQCFYLFCKSQILKLKFLVLIDYVRVEPRTYMQLTGKLSFKFNFSSSLLFEHSAIRVTKQKSKSNLYYTRLIPFRVSRVSCARLRGFAPGPTHQGRSGNESLATRGRFDRLGI